MDSTARGRSRLHMSNDAMYKLLREGCITEFNAKKASGDTCDLRGCDLWGLYLRGLDADGLDFSDCYFRQSNLRGIDLSKANLEGAQHKCLQNLRRPFSRRITASEIELSLLHGTHLRYSKT